MESTNKNKHLTLDDRYEIQNGLNKSMSFKAIGLSIGKDCTTISKEVKTHIQFLRKGAPYRPFNDCINRDHCNRYGDVCPDCTRKNKKKCSICGLCIPICPDYKKESCPSLNKSPYVCNGCSTRNVCTLEKRLYEALSAQKEYEAVRSESRSGFNLTKKELKQLDSVISPLLKNGQSIHHILTNNPDQVLRCEKTIYTYVDNGLFSGRNVDMPRKVRFRVRKKKSVELKVDKACRKGRTFDDYKKYREEHPELLVNELMKLSTWLSLIANVTSSSVASGLAYLMFSKIVPEKIQVSCKTIPNCFLKEDNEISFEEILLNNIFPSCGSWNLIIKLMSVVLPAPVGPTIATLLPFLISNEKSLMSSLSST